MKKSIYNTILKLTEKTGVIYNSFTNIYLFTSNEKCEIYKNNDVEEIEIRYPVFFEKIKQAGIIIDDIIDEKERVISIANFVDNNCESCHLVIIPTMDCNFRCWYCYENHIKGSCINDVIEERIKCFILNLITKESNLSNLHISYFGGEPLLKFKTIHEINKFVILNKREKINFSISFTTNGGLLNNKMISYLISLKINVNFQITLDGNRDHHDNVRFYSNGKRSYDIIINNIKKLIAEKFHVSLRLNYTNENIYSMVDIIKDLSDIPIENRDYLHISLFQVWQNAIENYNLINETTFVVDQFKLHNFEIKSIPSQGLYQSCYADKRNGVLINYNGDVFRCTARDFVHERRDGELVEDGKIKWLCNSNILRSAVK